MTKLLAKAAKSAAARYTAEHAVIDSIVKASDPSFGQDLKRQLRAKAVEYVEFEANGSEPGWYISVAVVDLKLEVTIALAIDGAGPR